jgi:hypothetical protein
MFWYTDPAAPSAFTTVARRSFVAQPATPPAACGDDAVAGVEAAPEAPEAAEEPVPAGDVEDAPPDEQPATAPATTPAAATPPSFSINEAELNITIHPLLMSGEIACAHPLSPAR